MLKKIPFFAFILGILCQSYQIQAQITITAADLPVIGTTKNIKQQNLPNISVGTASATAQTWDYSNLTGEPKTVEFIDAGTTPATADFPNSSMARVAPLPELLGVALPNLGFDLGGLQGTAYYHTGASNKILNDGININLDVFGFSLGQQNLITNPADLYLAPMTYGQTITNSSEFSQTITIDIDTISPIPVPLSFIITVDRNTSADAFGTMQLPGVQQPYSVLRYNEAGTVTIFVGVVVFGVPLLTLVDQEFGFQNYRFMTNGQNYPLVSVLGNPIGMGPAIASAEYINNGTVGIEDAPTQTLAQAYPNPANEALYLKTPEVVADNTYSLELYNALGQKVITADYNHATSQSVAHLPSGLYTYALVHNADAKVLLSGKVTIQH